MGRFQNGIPIHFAQKQGQINDKEPKIVQKIKTTY